MLRSLLDPTGTSNRLGYLGRVFLCLILTALPGAILAGRAPADMLDVLMSNTLQALTGMIITIATARRLRDLGASPWLALLPPLGTVAVGYVAYLTGLPGLNGSAALAGMAFIIAMLTFPGYGSARPARAT